MKGILLFVEYYGCRCKYLNSATKIDRVLRKSIHKNGMHLKEMDWAIHIPQGKTISAIIEESSIVIGTYPELNSLSINVHTCGNANVKGFMRDMRIFFRPRKVVSMKPYLTGR